MTSALRAVNTALARYSASVAGEHWAMRRVSCYSELARRVGVGRTCALHARATVAYPPAGLPLRMRGPRSSNARIRLRLAETKSIGRKDTRREPCVAGRQVPAAEDQTR
jgi:hypothetical protein